MKEKILNFLEKNHKPLPPDVLARRLNIRLASDYKAFIKVLNRLENEKKVRFLKTGEVTLVESGPRLPGTFRANLKGFGFVTVDKSEPDVFIPRGKTLNALDGDSVEIEIVKNGNALSGTSAEGRVRAILEHGKDSMVGVFVKSEDAGYIGGLLFKSKKLPFPVMIVDKGLSPKDGQIVKLEILSYPTPAQKYLTAFVTKIIGDADDQGVDVLEILESMDIKSDFPEDVRAQVAGISSTVNETDLKGREDFREEITYTIDGADSKDLDDAIHVKRLANGNFELGVHIADVSWYVTEGSALDREALDRATSVYVTDRVVPMLPVELSNGICSLNEGLDRLTQSCIMEIDSRGQIVNHRIVSSVIRTTYRMTYDAVNQMIAGEAAALAQFSKIADSVKLAVKLHQTLEKMRQERGALDFETTESKIVVNDNGMPIDIVARTRGVAERMIESFMLAANETVAGHFMAQELPFIYRIHETPKVEKMKIFVDFASSVGLPFQGRPEKLSNRELQAFMRRVDSTPYAAVMNMLLLRSMQQAHYSETNVGHFGLAAKNYTHFTSPIRRYPDLLVHRLIRAYASDVTDKKVEHFNEVIPDIAAQSSSRERRAVDAEREVEKIKKAEYMAQFVEQEFDGTISGVTNFGAFVALDNTVEGLVAVRAMKEFFNFNERTMSLQGEKSGLTFRIGGKIRVKVTRSDKNTGEIDFAYLPSDLDLFEKVVKSDKQQQRRGSRPFGRGNNQKPGAAAADKDKKAKDSARAGKQPYYRKAAKKSQRGGRGNGQKHGR